MVYPNPISIQTNVVTATKSLLLLNQALDCGLRQRERGEGEGEVGDQKGINKQQQQHTKIKMKDKGLLQTYFL